MITIIEWEGLRTVADAYRSTSLSLDALAKAVDSQKRDELKGVVAQYILSNIVTKSFACEMYLKMYISIDGKKLIKTHDLYHLFSALSITYQEKIKNIIYAKMILLDKGYDKNEIENDIKKISNAFVDWRYFYEKTKSISIRFLDIFLSSLFDETILPPFVTKKIT